MGNRSTRKKTIHSPQLRGGQQQTGQDRRGGAPVSTWVQARNTFDTVLQRAAPIAPIALRLSLGLIFLWFGMLKLGGDSPVNALVSATLPWVDPDTIVRILGVVEVGLGIGLIVGRAQRLLLIALVVHLSGTFLTFVMAPGLTVQGGNPFLLTADGEFVLKNLVLISAALLLACQRPTGRGEPAGSPALERVVSAQPGVAQSPVETDGVARA